jgi:hypothetical protein
LLRRFGPWHHTNEQGFPMSDNLENAGDIAGDVGIYAAEAALGIATGGLSVIGEKVIQDNTGFSVHDAATEGYKMMGEDLGDASYNATSEETHQAALGHYEASGEAWDKGEYGTAVVEGAESVGSIVGGLAESAWDAVTGD